MDRPRSERHERHAVSLFVNKVTKSYILIEECDVRLPQRCWRALRSVEWWSFTDVSGQPIGRISKVFFLFLDCRRLSLSSINKTVCRPSRISSHKMFKITLLITSTNPKLTKISYRCFCYNCTRVEFTLRHRDAGIATVWGRFRQKWRVADVFTEQWWLLASTWWRHQPLWMYKGLMKHEEACCVNVTCVNTRKFSAWMSRVLTRGSLLCECHVC
jgi:hypothetical protein